ncbi:MAG: ABC transporter ATP-binding protein [Bacillota bacterium]|jgi:ABC-type lipoprotein export system ATPase subunit
MPSLSEQYRPLLTVKSLGKHYPGVRPTYALRQASFRVYRGDFVVILGPSGSGKSTLLNLLGGLDKPTMGQIQLDDQAYGALSEAELTELRRQRLGFIFQYFNLLSSLTAVENVGLPLLTAGLPLPEVRQRSLEMLEQVGLSHRAEHFAGQLSGGEQQRVAVARALVHRPDLVLGDEPTGNLDSKNGQMIKDLLRRLNQEMGQTFILVSHDATFRRLANRVIYMSDGEIDRIEVKQRDSD